LLFFFSGNCCRVGAIDDTNDRQWKANYQMILSNGIKDLKEKGLMEVTLSEHDFRDPSHTLGESDILTLQEYVKRDNFCMKDNQNNTFTFIRSNMENVLGM
jgi:hypothetical protein